MNDVRLVATNPDDNTLVPVASNSSGQLAVQYPSIDKVPNDLEVEGDLTVSGNATIAGVVDSLQFIAEPDGGGFVASRHADDLQVWRAGSTKFNPGVIDTYTSMILSDGRALFAGDVIVGSRSKEWTLVEQGGLCHMIERVRANLGELVDPATEYPKLRDVFAELDVVEKALEQVMEKLRMVEPDGWPVWDGSDNS